MDRSQFDSISVLQPFPTQVQFVQLVDRLQDKVELSQLYLEICTEVSSDFFYDCDLCDGHSDPNLSRKRIKTKILAKVPQLALFLKNIHPGAAHQVEALSVLRREVVDFSNISDFKRDLRSRHEARWTRLQKEDQGNNEAQ
jgi:hypothetical protein